ncbi:MAG: arsenic resistance N-acetyltransferase ArsN2 [Acidiferrobacterales bacterium]
MATDLQYRLGASNDLAIINRLLAEAHLPWSDVELHLRNFMVACEEERVVGFIGLEVYGHVALLRSLVVAPQMRGRGIGTQLCERACARALAQGVRDLYLLTLDAECYFAARGFRQLDRSLAPKEIQATQQYTELCPASAVLMYRPLAGKNPQGVESAAPSVYS